MKASAESSFEQRPCSNMLSVSGERLLTGHYQPVYSDAPVSILRLDKLTRHIPTASGLGLGWFVKGLRFAYFCQTTRSVT